MSEIPVTIAHLEVDDVKRVRAVRMTPGAKGLTVIGGNNAQGKSSVIDAIMAALLGDKYRPSDPVRQGADKGEVRVTLSNGIAVERKFTAAGSYLKVTDGEGKKAGQTLLNGLLAELALNLGKFLRDDPRAKAKTLLQVIGVDLQPFEERLRVLEQDRLLKGREKDKAKGHAESLPYHDGLGVEPMDGAGMVRQMEQALQHNAKVRQVREEAEMLVYKRDKAAQRVDEMRKALAAAESELEELTDRAKLAADSAAKAAPVDTSTLKVQLEEIDAHNAKVRDNAGREAAFAQAEAFGEEYRAIQGEIDRVRAELKALLDAHPLPLDGLEIADGELRYQARAWDCMSGAERLRVATAVCHLVNPRCGFVLLDGLEQMDVPTLQEFGVWLEARGLQAIGTRVSTGGECSLVIEDGMGTLEAGEAVSFA
jgi:DNA repair ATPase RecN